MLTLAAESQQARSRCSSTTTTQGGRASRGGCWTQRKTQSPGSTHCTTRKERAAGLVPAFTLLQKRVKCTFAKASNVTFRRHKDQFRLTELSFYHEGLTQSILSDCACGFSRGVELSVERDEFPHVYSVPHSSHANHVRAAALLQFTTRGRLGVTAGGIQVITT